MMRNVYLEGEMGDKFGTGFQVNAPKVADIVKCIECNHPSFRKYLMDCHEQEIGFEVDIAKQKLASTDFTDCYERNRRTEVIFTAFLMGSNNTYYSDSAHN